jgi:hypothetical protein
MDRLPFPGFPVQKPAVSDHRRGGPDPGRWVRGGDEEDHQASSQVRILYPVFCIPEGGGWFLLCFVSFHHGPLKSCFTSI